MSEHYILEGKTPIPCDLQTWAIYFSLADRHVDLTERDGVAVSTVFLGLDHSSGHGSPLIFETLVFGGEHDGEMDRYSTWDEAMNGHLRMCCRAFGGNEERS